MTLCVYGFKVNLCSSRGCFQRCKVFVSDAFQGRHSFTELNENDFGFQTVSSCTTAEGRGAEKTRAIDKHCMATADSSINKLVRSFCIISFFKTNFSQRHIYSIRTYKSIIKSDQTRNQYSQAHPCEGQQLSVVLSLPTNYVMPAISRICRCY